MLTIRDEQFEKLSQSMREIFVDRMLAHLRRDFPEQCTLREVRKVDLRLLISEAITNAARYGITNESDVRGFIEYSILLPPEITLLEKVRWVSEILRRADLDGTAKMDLINEHLVFAQATKA